MKLKHGQSMYIGPMWEEHNERFDRGMSLGLPFNMVRPDPAENYGIGGLRITLYLREKESRNGVQFQFYDHEAIYPGNRKKPFTDYMGTDVGYHATEPQYAEQTLIQADCSVTGGNCYYDGSGLRASEWMDEFAETNFGNIWEKLEAEYTARFDMVEV